MTKYMVKYGFGTGSGRIYFTNPAPVGFPKSKSFTALFSNIRLCYLSNLLIEHSVCTLASTRVLA